MSYGLLLGGTLGGRTLALTQGGTALGGSIA